MGIAERRQRELTELTEAALAAVQEIAEGEGWDAVTIRRVAEAVEWSPPKLYTVFGDKAGLLARARERAFEDLLAELEAVTATEPLTRVQEYVQRYWAFATASPTRFQLMHGLAPAPCLPAVDHATIPPAQAAFALLVDAVGALATDADADRVDAEAQLLWASVYGIAGLALTGQLPPDADGAHLSRLAASRTWHGRGVG